MAAHAPQARALYRRLLRELPSRTPSILANPSPIQHHIRADISASTASDLPLESSESLQTQLQKSADQRIAEAEQYIHYLRAQRQYITLVERYNPGMNMNEEERVRLSARRVGINLPEEYDAGKDA